MIFIEFLIKSEKNFSKKDKIRENLQAELSKSDGKLHFDNVKQFLYLTQTDEDLNLLIDAIKKY